MTTSPHRATKKPAAPRREIPPAAKPNHLVLGDWEIGTELGTGRWAKVFSARHAATSTGGSDYALKTLKENSAKELSFHQGRSMLQREALIGRQVSHPNLAPVLVCQLKGQPFIVMPRIAGCTLRTLQQHRRREYGCLIGAAKFLPQSIWIARQIAAALSTLHAAGWMHGDVKPENIMVSANGHATLIDLGLARKLGSRECRGGEVLVGTLAYVSPESFLPAAMLRAESDLYSLGVLLYELLTGQPLFEETDPTLLALRHLRDSPADVREAALDVPPPLAQIVMRMLAKEPLRRPTASEVVQRLTRLEIEMLGTV